MSEDFSKKSFKAQVAKEEPAKEAESFPSHPVLQAAKAAQAAVPTTSTASAGEDFKYYVVVYIVAPNAFEPTYKWSVFPKADVKKMEAFLVNTVIPMTQKNYKVFKANDC